VWLTCAVLLVTLGTGVLSQVPARQAVLRVYIARHGETASNAERRVLGQLDEPLNGRGRMQAEALRERFRGIPLDSIYSSPLARSLETALVVAEGRSVRALSSLRERHQGRFQGLLADTQPDFAPRMRVPEDDLGGGETVHALSARARAAARSIRTLHTSGSVLVVGHFLMNQMLLRELAGLSLDQAMRVNQANDEVYLVELEAGAGVRLWKLIHLSNLGDL
jgi:broad specificity phosphatase PhoE